MINKRIFFAILALGIFACTFENSYEPEEEEIIVPDTTRYIFTYETWNQMQGGRNSFKALGYPIVDSLQTIPTIVVDVPAGRAVLRKFTNSAGDEYPALFVEKDEAIYELMPIKTEGDTGDTSAFWYMNMIQADQAWEAGFMGDSSTTAIIIDTKLRADCKGGRPAFVAFDSSLSRNPYTDSTDVWGTDVLEHGTFVFNLLAGERYSYGGHIESLYIQGAAPQARVGVISMFEEYSATRAIAVKSVDIAITLNPDVVSMSWGSSTFSPSMMLLLEKGKEKGIAFVAAAGNTWSSPIIYPARYSPVIAVGSVDSDTTRSFFSSYGDFLEIMAPGRDILSFYGCNLAKKSGTSVSTLLVSGAILLLNQKAGQLYGDDYRPSLNQIRKYLWDSALVMEDSEETGFGLLQVMDFLNQLGE